MKRVSPRKNHFLKIWAKCWRLRKPGPDGSFTFNFINVQKELGLVDGNYAYNHSGETGDNASGKLYKVLRLRVENKYYCSPDENIKIDPWKGIDLGALVSYVKSYTLKVKVESTNGKFWDMAKGQGSPLSRDNDYAYSKRKVEYVPNNEGENNNSSTRQIISIQKTVDQKESEGNGYVTFYHLVQHNPDNQLDRYYIKCTPDKNKGDFVFKTREESYYPLYNKDKNNFPFNSSGQYLSTGGGFQMPISYGENITWNSELQVKTYT